MPKKESVVAKNSSSEDESYDSEDEYSQSENLPNQKPSAIREVNRQNILNYESDSSDEVDDDESEDVYMKVKTSKPQFSEQIDAKNVWGANKKSFYATGKGEANSDDGMSSSEAEEDQQKEAERLADIRRKKLAKQMAQREAQEEALKSISSEEDQIKSDSDDSMIEGDFKLGNKLFESGDNEENKTHQKVLSITDDPRLARAILDQESPELKQLLEEFNQTLQDATKKVLPLLQKAKQGSVPSTAAGISYLEMKHSLMMSYCTFLSFYLLMKVEGKDVTDHPVLYRLTHIKTLLEKLKPLDQKLESQILKLTKTAKKFDINNKSDSESNSDLEEGEEELDDSSENLIAKKPAKSSEKHQATHLTDQVFMGDKNRSESDDYDEEDDYGDEVLESKYLTKKELQQKKLKNEKEMEQRLNNLDDDNAAIESTIKRKSANKSKTLETSAKKIESQKTETKTKVNFSQLKNKQIKGDDVYKQNQERLRDKKLARKQEESQNKQRVQGEIQQMGDRIQRNINYDIEKAKGITRKRKREDKNPRVRRRRQAERLEKRHKTQVQHFKEGPQSLYSGEQQGIRAGLKKSTKLT